MILPYECDISLIPEIYLGKFVYTYILFPDMLTHRISYPCFSDYTYTLNSHVFMVVQVLGHTDMRYLTMDIFKILLVPRHVVGNGKSID